jgi:hypothetical protein
MLKLVNGEFLKNRTMEEAFNVKINYGNQAVTLTILHHKDYFKVIYFGGIIGAVRQVDGEWELMDFQEIDAGDLPRYTPDAKGERLEIVLDEHTVYAIGKEIELYNSGED